MTDQTTLPAPLKKAAEESQMALNRAEKIASNYAPFLGQLQEQADALKKLSHKKPEDIEKAKRIRIDIGHICVEVGKQKKKDKEKITLAQRYIDGLYNTVNGFGRITQDEASDLENHAAKLLEDKAAELQTTRAKELAKYYEDEVADLGKMSKPVWENFLAGCKATFEEEAEEKRLEQMEADKAEKAEKERIAEQAKENERLKQEADKAEKARLEAEAAAKATMDKLAAEKKEEQDKAAKLAEEIRLRREADEAEEKAKLEQAAKLQAEADALAMAPVKEQLTEWVSKFEVPDANLKEANDTAAMISKKFIAFKNWAQQEVDKL